METRKEKKALENLEYFPIVIKIQFLKVPKRGSTDCNFGLGLCFTIVITFVYGGGTSTPQKTFYNPKTEEIGGWGMVDKTRKDSMVIHFPKELSKSPFHTEEDLKVFLVPKDKNYGDITFIEGKYNLERAKDGYNYSIKIKNK